MVTMFNTKIACHQPNLFPWLGYFELINNVDTFVVLDDVQWIKQGRIHRTKIIKSETQYDWLTLPIHSQNHRQKTIQQMQTATGEWAQSHLSLIHQRYKKYPYYASQVKPILESFFSSQKNSQSLLDITLESIFIWLEHLNINTAIEYSSQWNIQTNKSQRLIDICQTLEANVYYSSLGSARYLDYSLFRSQDIKIEMQHLKLFHGHNIHRPTDLSIIDWAALYSWQELQQKIRRKDLFDPSRIENGQTL